MVVPHFHYPSCLKPSLPCLPSWNSTDHHYTLLLFMWSFTLGKTTALIYFIYSMPASIQLYTFEEKRTAFEEKRTAMLIIGLIYFKLSLTLRSFILSAYKIVSQVHSLSHYSSPELSSSSCLLYLTATWDISPLNRKLNSWPASFPKPTSSYKNLPQFLQPQTSLMVLFISHSMTKLSPSLADFTFRMYLDLTALYHLYSNRLSPSQHTLN